MKLFITFSNVRLEAPLNCLRERTDAGVHSVTKGGLQGYYQHLRTTKGASLEKDNIKFDVTDKIKISNPNEKSSFGKEGDAVMTYGGTSQPN